MNSIQLIISELESEDLSKSSPAVIRALLDKFYSRPIPALVTELPPKSFIFRARKVDDFGEIQSEKDLTYRLAEENDRYGRATSPRSTMFYGTYLSIQSNEDIGKVACGSLVESCGFLREPPTQNEYKAVVGIWEVIEPLEFNTVIDPVWEDNPTNRHRNLVSQFDNVYSENPEINMDDAKAFHSFLFKHYNKPVPSDREYEYWIPALATPSLIIPYDGVIYESVQCFKSALPEVMCVAIKPESADRKLVLSSIEAYTFTYYATDNRFMVVHHPLNLPTHQS